MTNQPSIVHVRSTYILTLVVVVFDSVWNSTWNEPIPVTLIRSTRPTVVGYSNVITMATSVASVILKGSSLVVLK